MARKKSALPKRVAGVKVPKTLRRSKLLRASMDSPMGRKVMAEALTAAAGAAAAVLLKEREQVAEAGGQVAEAGQKTVKKGARAVEIAAEAVHSAAGAAIEVVTEAAKSVLPQPPKPRKPNGDVGEGQASH